MKQRILALLLTAVLCISLAACSSTSTTPAETNPGTSESTNTPVIPNEGTDEVSAAPDESTTVDTASDEPSIELVSWPLDEKVEYTVWQTSTSLPTGYTDYNELTIYQELESRTNVHLDWSYATIENAKEQFSLMLTSSDWTDVFISPELTNGFDYNIEEEIIIDLLPLIPNYMPNYWSMLSADELMLTDAMTDEGRLPFLSLLNESVDPVFMGYFGRQDWIEAAGMTELHTYDDWETLLAWAKSEKGISGLFMGSSTGMFGMLMSGFNAYDGFVAMDHQTVEYSPITKSYYNYLEKMSDWYAKGYIDPDFTSRSMFYTLGGMFSDGSFALFPTIYGFYDMLLPAGQANDPNFNMVGVDYPCMNEGDAMLVPVAHNTGVQGGAKTCISYSCENPELILQWFDYLFSEEGAYLSSYGVEGTHYTLEADGIHVTPTELALSETETNKTYTLMSFVPHYVLDRSTVVTASEGALACTQIWDSRWDPANNITMPNGLSLTAEEAETNTHLTDVQTYVQEYTLQIITGQENLASSWDSYVDAIYAMHIQDCIDAYQAAYTRYINR